MKRYLEIEKIVYQTVRAGAGRRGNCAFSADYERRNCQKPANFRIGGRIVAQKPIRRAQ